jgi:membrane protein implicated in regulation of membrane protease activity
VALVVALLLAVFVLDRPWSLLVVVGALCLEVAEIFGWMWYARRGSAQVGAETLIGSTAVVFTSCRPRGQVRVQGEIWDAVCAAGAAPGERVRVTARDGLTLVVEPDAR